MKMAHRASYEQFKGNIEKGLFVCHTCDNGICINPDHLFLGTNSDNQKDAYRKGRTSFNGILKDQSGERNSGAKYNKEFIISVRDYYSENNISFGELARVFNLKSRGHAHAIVTRRIWKDI